MRGGVIAASRDAQTPEEIGGHSSAPPRLNAPRYGLVAMGGLDVPDKDDMPFVGVICVPHCHFVTVLLYFLDARELDRYRSFRRLETVQDDIRIAC